MIEHQLAKAGVIFGQVVNFGWGHPDFIHLCLSTYSLLAGKGCNARLFRLLNDVLNGDAQGRVFGNDLHGLYLDEVAKPLLQGTLHEKLGCRNHFCVAGIENELGDASAEIGQIDALAGHGEQHLFDVLTISGGRDEAFIGHAQWIRDIHRLCSPLSTGIHQIGITITGNPSSVITPTTSSVPSTEIAGAAIFISPVSISVEALAMLVSRLSMVRASPAIFVSTLSMVSDSPAMLVSPLSMVSDSPATLVSSLSTVRAAPEKLVSSLSTETSSLVILVTWLVKAKVASVSI